MYSKLFTSKQNLKNLQHPQLFIMPSKAFINMFHYSDINNGFVVFLWILLLSLSLSSFLLEIQPEDRVAILC